MEGQLFPEGATTIKIQLHTPPLQITCHQCRNRICALSFIVSDIQLQPGFYTLKKRNGKTILLHNLIANLADRLKAMTLHRDCFQNRAVK